MVFAQVDDFIQQNKIASYNCPDQENYQQLEDYLSNRDLTEQQRFALSVEKAQFLICDGKTAQAQPLLFDAIMGVKTEPDPYFYASAIYQLAFTFDVAEDDRRCEYYSQAKALSSTSLHPDIHLSASLGVITNCLIDKQITHKLSAMYEILHRYSDSQDKGALAQIHNSIGLIYGLELAQHAVAAEQYMKAHNLGKEIHTGSNQLDILISVFTAQMASGKFEDALKTTKLIEQVNAEVDSTSTNFRYYFALSGYYYRVGDIEEMKTVLPKLQIYADTMANPYIDKIVEWYQTVPCVHERDLECVQNYLDNNPSPVFETNALYLNLLVQMHILLSPKDKVLEMLSTYEKIESRRYFKAQDSAAILSISQFYNQIEELESEIEQQKLARQRLLIVGITLTVFALLLIAMFARKKILAQQAVDPETQLLNAKALMSRILKLPRPNRDKTNALALFDITNLREINQVVGLVKSHEILHKIARSFIQVTRANDLIGRFGAEQFVLCLHNVDERNARQFFNRVQTELDNIEYHNGDEKIANIESQMSVFTTTDKFTDLEEVFEDMLESVRSPSQHNR